MSYSQCIKCEEMVSSYEKYCNDCVKKHNLKQDKIWHKRRENWYSNYDKEAEFKKDKT